MCRTFRVIINDETRGQLTESCPFPIVPCRSMSGWKHPPFDMPLDKVCCFFTLPSEHLRQEVITKIIDYQIGRHYNDDDIVIFTFLYELVVINLCLISEQAVLLITDDRATIEFSCIYVVKQSEHIRALIWTERPT